MADPGGGLQDFQPVQGSAASSSVSPEHADLRVFRTFSSSEKSVEVAGQVDENLPGHVTPSIRADDSGCASPSVHRQSWTVPLCHRDWFPPRANCAEDHCDSSVQFFGKVVLPGVVQRQVPWLEVLSRDMPLLWWSRQCLWSSRSCSLSTVVDISTVSQRPSWCRKCSCGNGRRCVHAATVSSTIEVPQILVIARVCGCLVVLRDGYATFSSCVMVVMKVFWAHFAPFFALFRSSRS